MAFYIGCSGWSYEGWKRNFYPETMGNKDYLPIIQNSLDLLKSILLIIIYLRDLQLEGGKTKHLQILVSH
jgi:hypothetical protein